MTEARRTDQVNPKQLLLAFLITTEGNLPNDPDEPERLTVAEAAAILSRIADQLGISPPVASDLFRRCCAMANFFAVESNRKLVGVDDEGQPEPAVGSGSV